jgi:hypothetical protein
MVKDGYRERLEGLSDAGDNNLHDAVRRGALDGVDGTLSLLNTYDVNPFIKNQNGKTALEMATEDSVVELLKEAEEKFLTKKLDPLSIARYKKAAEQVDNLGNNDLHKAAEKGDLREVKFLVERLDLDLNQRNDKGKTPKNLAIDEEIIDYLQEQRQLQSERNMAVIEDERSELLKFDRALNELGKQFLKKDEELDRESDDDEVPGIENSSLSNLEAEMRELFNKLPDNLKDKFSEVMKDMNNIDSSFEAHEPNPDKTAQANEAMKAAYNDLPEDLKVEFGRVMEGFDKISDEVYAPPLTKGDKNRGDGGRL